MKPQSNGKGLLQGSSGTCASDDECKDFGATGVGKHGSCSLSIDRFKGAISLLLHVIEGSGSSVLTEEHWLSVLQNDKILLN